MKINPKKIAYLTLANILSLLILPIGFIAWAAKWICARYLDFEEWVKPKILND